MIYCILSILQANIKYTNKWGGVIQTTLRPLSKRSDSPNWLHSRAAGPLVRCTNNRSISLVEKCESSSFPTEGGGGFAIFPPLLISHVGNKGPRRKTIWKSCTVMWAGNWWVQQCFEGSKKFLVHLVGFLLPRFGGEFAGLVLWY